jgi:hypothetical protein
VKTAGKEGREQQVEERVDGGVLQEKKIEADLHNDVESVNLGEGNAVDGHGSQGVEEDLEGAEEGLAKDRVENKGFESGWEIGIEAINAKGLVMGEMVGLDTS